MRYTLDATNQSLGRLASEVAVILRGKNLVSYMPNRQILSEVIIKNLKSAKFTGSKMKNKKYYRYSGYHSGITARDLSELWEQRPERVLRDMVYNMLPKNKTRSKIIKNLHFK